MFLWFYASVVTEFSLIRETVTLLHFEEKRSLIDTTELLYSKENKSSSVMKALKSKKS